LVTTFFPSGRTLSGELATIYVFQLSGYFEDVSNLERAIMSTGGTGIGNTGLGTAPPTYRAYIEKLLTLGIWTEAQRALLQITSLQTVIFFPLLPNSTRNSRAHRDGLAKTLIALWTSTSTENFLSQVEKVNSFVSVATSMIKHKLDMYSTMFPLRDGAVLSQEFRTINSAISHNAVPSIRVGNTKQDVKSNFKRKYKAKRSRKAKG
jgi:hypothetical protein